MELDGKLRKEITRLFYKQAPFVSISLFFVLAVIYYYFHPLLSGPLFHLWFGSSLLFSILLLVAYAAYRSYADRLSNRAWLSLYIVLMVPQDLLLGMLGPISTQVTEEVHRFMILFLLAGMAAGALATRGILFKVYLVSVSGLLLPVAVTYAMNETPLATVLLILTLVFYFFMLFVGENYSNSIRDNILLWLNLEQEIEVRKRTEEELVAAKQRAESANETKNQFLASVSHELRTPLNGIIGFSSALQKHPLETDDKNYVEQIGLCSRTLLHMVNDILDITTIEAGRLELKRYPFNLLQEMDEVAALAQRLCEDKGLKFHYHFDSNAPRHLRGDGQRVKQIVSNLISNAIKYTDTGYVKLEAETLALDEGRAWMRFSVEDSGIGIPESAGSTLFDSFTQADSFANRRHDGVGLGLSIVKNLLQQMEGSIDYQSEVGKGSRFNVRLPLQLDAGNTIRTPKLASETAAPKPNDGKAEAVGQLRLLIVDDNDINRLVLKTFLEPYHVPCDEAASGTQALKMLESHAYDVVLLDINMPDISGLEVRKRFHGEEKNGPYFVAITAHAFESEIREIIAAGFEECLIKPIAETELIGVLKRLVAQG